MFTLQENKGINDLLVMIGCTTMTTKMIVWQAL